MLRSSEINISVDVLVTGTLDTSERQDKVTRSILPMLNLFCSGQRGVHSLVIHETFQEELDKIPGRSPPNQPEAHDGRTDETIDNKGKKGRNRVSLLLKSTTTDITSVIPVITNIF